MEYNELDYVKACRSGHTEQFGGLYDLYSRKIYDFLYFRTHHRETAEDLTSVVFAKALEKISSFDERKGNFSSWLYRIARNTVIDHYRSFKQTDDLENAWDAASRTDVPRDIDTAERLRQVKSFLNTLPKLQREIVLLRVWDNLSHKEIAEVLGISEANAKVTFSRALAKINKEFAAALLLLLVLSLQ